MADVMDRLMSHRLRACASLGHWDPPYRLSATDRLPITGRRHAILLLWLHAQYPTPYLMPAVPYAHGRPSPLSPVSLTRMGYVELPEGSSRQEHAHPSARFHLSGKRCHRDFHNLLHHAHQYGHRRDK